MRPNVALRFPRGELASNIGTKGPQLRKTTMGCISKNSAAKAPVMYPMQSPRCDLSNVKKISLMCNGKGSYNLKTQKNLQHLYTET